MSSLRRLSDWFRRSFSDLRDAWTITDPHRFGTKFQTIVIPHLGAINRNGRKYTMDMAKKICGELRTNLVGQIGYPDDSAISLKNASHRIHRTFIGGNSLWAEYSVLDTPSGRLLYELFDNTGADSFVLSPRGFGSVRSNGEFDRYELVTFDFIPKSESAFRPYTHNELVELGISTFVSADSFYEWYDHPQPELNGLTPREMVSNGKIQTVYTLLHDMQIGEFTNEQYNVDL